MNSSFALSGLVIPQDPNPRALPRAVLLKPFGLKLATDTGRAARYQFGKLGDNVARFSEPSAFNPRRTKPGIFGESHSEQIALSIESLGNSNHSTAEPQLTAAAELTRVLGPFLKIRIPTTASPSSATVAADT